MLSCFIAFKVTAMNMAMILTAIISGFIGGVLGAMVLHEILDQKFEQKFADDEKQTRWSLFFVCAGGTLML